MSIVTDNETWVVDEGDRIIRKKAASGFESLSIWERLVYAFWVADYGMRNAGDLYPASELLPDFQQIALQAAKELSLPLTRDAFALELEDLEKEYLERFEAVCDEIRRAKRN